jgi:hypothetical protein
MCNAVRQYLVVTIVIVILPVSVFGDEHDYYDQLVKEMTGYYVFMQGGVDWVFGQECEVIGFTPSRTAQIAPGSGDPGFSDVILVPDACTFPEIDGQVVFAFNVQFDSLTQLGTWDIMCHGFGATPLWCPNGCYGCIHYGCTLDCDTEVIYESFNDAYLHITAENDPPTASISHSPTPAWNQVVTLNSNASDPDGGSLNFSWSIIDKPASSIKTLSSTSAANPTIGFTNDDDIGSWGFRLYVDDNEGERVLFTHSFDVPNVEPHISSISGELDINATETIALSVTPTDDVDGGSLTFSWDIDSAPSGASEAPQSGYSTSSSINIPTTDIDIGTWEFTVTATDDEDPPGTDTESVTVIVHNIPPEINFDGDDVIDIGDAIDIETTVLTDEDGGDLEFIWDIVQAPQSSSLTVQSAYHSGTGAAGAGIYIPTDFNDAGTWIFRLTAIDDDSQPDSEIEAEFMVVVDGPVFAEITGPDLIGSLSFPLVLSGTDSLDTDSPCEGIADRCHDTLDGRPVSGITAGIQQYTWYLADVPFEAYGTYPLGRVDDAFGISAIEPTMSIDFADLQEGDWVFELEVVDAEDNADLISFIVTVVDETGPPIAILNPTRRYEVDFANIVSEDIALDGSASFDLDNILIGDPLGPGVGITEYKWNYIVSPLGCSPPAMPSDTGTSSFNLYDNGDGIAPGCLGVWQIGLTVTDDDSTPKEATSQTSVIIGDCPELLCINYPTNALPATVAFSDNTDIIIYYRMDAMLYDDPFFLYGLFTELEIYHESELITPVYTDYDPNVLASNKGSMLIFHWNGFTDSDDRPEQGAYTIKLKLTNSALMHAGFIEAIESDAILIEVAEPEILPSSDKFIDFDALDATVPTDTIDIDYNFSGSAVPDQIRWRIRDAANSEIFVHTEALGGSISWDGKVSGSTLPAGIYTIEIELLRTGDILGTSAPFHFVVYQMSLIPASGIYPGPLVFAVPDQLVLVNDDDDNSNGIVDSSEGGPLLGENDLEEMTLQFSPNGLPPELHSNLSLTAHSGGANVKLWETADKTSEILLDAVHDLTTDTPPAQFFVEGLTTGDTELRLIIEDGITATEIVHKSVTVHVHNIDIDVDSDMSGTLDVADEAVEMDDQAIIVYVNNDDDGGAGNDAVTNAIIENAADKAELAEMTIRQNNNLPAGSILRLSVGDKNKIRIFDQNDNAIIGPPAADGGPDIAQYDIPHADIAAGDLTFRIECVHGGLQTISLELFDSAMTLVAQDEMKVALNVHRRPGAAYETIRNRVNLTETIADLEGLKATLDGTKPIVSWDPTPPHTKTTSFWISIQHNTIDNWLQTGVRVIRSSAGVDTEELYFEFVPNYPNYQNGTDPLGYQIFTKAGAGWTVGDFQVEITDRTIGEAKAFHGGTAWRTATHADFITAVFHNYQMGTEPKQTVSRIPGSAASKAGISGAEYKDTTGWHATAFSASDIEIHSTDGRGTVNNVSAVAPVTSANLDDMNYNWVSGQEYQLWDDRN